MKEARNKDVRNLETHKKKQTTGCARKERGSWASQFLGVIFSPHMHSFPLCSALYLDQPPLGKEPYWEIKQGQHEQGEVSLEQANRGDEGETFSSAETSFHMAPTYGWREIRIHRNTIPSARLHLAERLRTGLEATDRGSSIVPF